MRTLNSLPITVLHSCFSFLLLLVGITLLFAKPVQAATMLSEGDVCLPAPEPTVSSALGDPFDQLDTTVWATDPETHFAPFVLCGDNVLKLVGTPESVWRSKLFYRRPMVSGQMATIEFKLDSLNAKANFAIENGSDGIANRFGIEADRGKIYAKIFTGTFLFPGTLLTPTKLNTWYELSLTLDDDTGFVMALRDTESGQTATYTHKMPTGMEWRFSHYVQQGNSYIDNFAQTGGPLAISTIADQRINEDTGTGVIPFRIGNFGPITTPVTVTVTNSNPGRLFPLDSVVLGGSGLNRTIVITPAADQSGSATFTVTLATDTETSQRAFKVFVGPVNDPPTISPIDYKNTRRVPGGEPIGPLLFVVGDIDNLVISLTVSVTTSNLAVLSPENIIILGSSPTHTMTLIPSAQTPGDVTVTVTVSDVNSSASTSFNLSTFARRFAPLVFGPAPAPPEPPCEIRPVDCFEPNNGFNSATPLTMPSSISATVYGQIDQRDYFAVDLLAGHQYTVSIAFSTGDLDLYLYADADRLEPVVKSDRSDTRYETLTYTPKQDGRFYILVFNYLPLPEPTPVLHEYRLQTEVQ